MQEPIGQESDACLSSRASAFWGKLESELIPPRRNQELKLIQTRAGNGLYIGGCWKLRFLMPRPPFAFCIPKPRHPLVNRLTPDPFREIIESVETQCSPKNKPASSMVR